MLASALVSGAPLRGGSVPWMVRTCVHTGHATQLRAHCPFCAPALVLGTSNRQCGQKRLLTSHATHALHRSS